MNTFSIKIKDQGYIHSFEELNSKHSKNGPNVPSWEYILKSWLSTASGEVSSK